ncbi:MAG: hypothetical protein VKJ87_03930 [Synechococcus sp.]|nr:hypothetical protein [Synechococcus sp.]
MPTLANALEQLQPGAQRWLSGGVREPQLQPAGERILLLADDEELVDWCELWAAWRLPVVLALPCSERIAAEAALHEALLQRRGVPLLGLLQVGGGWEATQRRRDALPWLGCWDPAEPLDLAGFQALLLRRFHSLDPSQGAA